MLSSLRRRRNKAAIPRIPRKRPPMRSQVPALTRCLAWDSADATGRSAMGTVGTAEFAEETSPDAGGAGGRFVDESFGAVAAAAAGAAL
jgi:hypothetical protein